MRRAAPSLSSTDPKRSGSSKRRFTTPLLTTLTRARSACFPAQHSFGCKRPVCFDNTDTHWTSHQFWQFHCSQENAVTLFSNNANFSVWNIAILTDCVLACDLFLLSMSAFCFCNVVTAYIFETLKPNSHNTPTMTAATLLLADGAVKDTHLFFFCPSV